MVLVSVHAHVWWEQAFNYEGPDCLNPKQVISKCCYANRRQQVSLT